MSGRADVLCYLTEVHNGRHLDRDLPDDIVAALDAKARRVGLSRTEYIRRALTRECTDAGSGVTVADLANFAHTFADLDDVEVMRRAWS